MICGIEVLSVSKVTKENVKQESSEIWRCTDDVTIGT